MSREDHETERWHFGDRLYGITLASAPDSMDLELDDIGPAPGRGLLMMTSQDDDSGDITLRVFSDERLPLGLVEQFLNEVRRRLLPHT